MNRMRNTFGDKLFRWCGISQKRIRLPELVAICGVRSNRSAKSWTDLAKGRPDLRNNWTQRAQSMAFAMIVATDPPYYDNIGYADLSDFFYVWLRRSLGDIYPDLFSTLLTPKARS